MTSLGTILSVWAHPDDESYCCAGIMAMAVEAGQRVACVTATRGELGSTDDERWPPGAPLAEVRTQELMASLAELGVTEHWWLDYPDGGCAAIDDAEAVARLRAIIEDVQPNSILTFGPDGATWHTDHIAVSRWSHLATQGTDIHVYNMANTRQWIENMSQYVPVEMVMMDDRAPFTVEPEQCVLNPRFDDAILDRKYRAMVAQKSQIEPMMAMMGEDAFREMLGEETFTDDRW